MAELDWLQPQQLQAWQADLDYVVGTDCIYKEQLVDSLLRVVLHLTGPHTTGEIQSAHCEKKVTGFQLASRFWSLFHGAQKFAGSSILKSCKVY